MNHTISMFIDDELDLDEKIEFVNKVHTEDQFYDESITLLEQEKHLRSDVVPIVPEVSLKKSKRFFDAQYLNFFFRFAKIGVMAAIVIFFVFAFQWKKDDAVPFHTVSKRFVIYKPEAGNVQISGSFTDWNNIPMKMIGPSGYWEIELDVSGGEHKYVFIVEDNKRIADPTVLMREKDDFGSENSVLVVEA